MVYYHTRNNPQTQNMPHLPKKTVLMLVYGASFFYSFHYALPLYIESSFISQFLSTEKMIGVIFAIAACFTISATFLFPRLLKRLGNYYLTLTTTGLEVAVLIALAIVSTPFIVIPLFIIHQILVNIIFLNLDEFVEVSSDNNNTGSIRGIFMTILSIAVAVAPLLAGLMLADHDFWKIYLSSALFMALCFLVIAKNFRHHQDPPYLVPRFKETLRTVIKSHDIHSSIFLHFLLAFFYSWMVIYTPIYLNTHIGIPMNKILGIIIPIALLPFIFFEVILGKIADTKLGEKEILTAGFLIMAFATMGLSIITTASIAVWAGALFITRVGASAVEAMTESYFYKKVGPEDINIITFMRMVRGSAYIIGPLLGSLILSYFEFQFIFFTLGVIMLLALPYALTIRDTR